MAMFLKTKTFFSCRFKSLTTLQRLNHCLIEDSPPYSSFISSDSESEESSAIDTSKWKKINSKVFGVHRSLIPPPARLVLNILHNNGFEAYLVGGCVRDLLLKRTPKDYDVITSADLAQVKNQFHRCQIVGERFPICRVNIQGLEVEVSSFKTVTKNTLEKEKVLLPKIPKGYDEKDFIRWKDSMHRDFTINSLFFDPFMSQIYDYASGITDLSSLKLRTVNPAHSSFEEDCARILRGLRIAGRLGLSISKDTENAIRKFSSSLTSLGKGRIIMELNYMLSYGAAVSTISLLQRFSILELFLPFQSAYLKQKAGELSSRDSVMLMKLFSNLDTLVSCDRPCDSKLWVALLAFHQALVTKPQDTLVLWVFASVLYHGKWVEGVEFARENANLPVKFTPEISGFSGFISDKELAEEVGHLAVLAKDALGSLVDADMLANYMSRYGISLSSGLVFVSKKRANGVAQIFDVLVNDIESYKVGRTNFMIDYSLLGKGCQLETRFVLGKVILETLRAGITKGQEVAERPKFIKEKHDSKISSIVKDRVPKWKDKAPTLPLSDCKQHPQIVERKRKLGIMEPIFGQEVAKKKGEVSLTDESLSREPKKIGMIDRINKKEKIATQGNNLRKKKVHSHEKPRYGYLRTKEFLKHEEKKDCFELLEDVVKEKTEKLKETLVKETEKLKATLVKEKSDQPSLSKLFRR